MARTAVVTGASRGGGKAIALQLGSGGWTVFVTGRSTRGRPDSEGLGGTVEETAAGIDAAGGHGIPVVCDHTQLAEIYRLVATITKLGHPPDLLREQRLGRVRAARPCDLWGPFLEAADPPLGRDVYRGSSRDSSHVGTTRSTHAPAKEGADREHRCVAERRLSGELVPARGEERYDSDGPRNGDGTEVPWNPGRCLGTRIHT